MLLVLCLRIVLFGVDCCGVFFYLLIGIIWIVFYLDIELRVCVVDCVGNMYVFVCKEVFCIFFIYVDMVVGG